MSRCWFIGISAVLMGSLAVFVRNIDAHPIVVAYFRLFVGFLFLLPLVRFVDFSLLKNSKILGIMIVSVATVLFYIASIQLMEVAVSALLLYMAPVYVIVIMRLKGERVNRVSMLSIVLGLVGLYLMLSPYGEIDEGIVFGLLSGFCYALYFILAKEVRSFASSIDVTFLSLMFASLVLFPAVLMFYNDAVRVLHEKTMWIAGIGLIPTALAFTLMNYGIKFCDKDKAPIVALIEPVSAGFFGYFVFNEILTVKQIIGAILVLLCVVMVRAGDVDEDEG